MMALRRIGLLPKLVYTLFVFAHVPFYWAWYGPAQLLWFSNLALLTGWAAFCLESRLLAGMAALAVLIPEMGWNLSFFGKLLLGKEMLGLTAYMFDAKIPRIIRALSLYHVVLPWILVFLLFRLGYDPRALPLQTLASWIVLPASFLFSSPERNINFVLGPENSPIPGGPISHLVLLMVLLPPVVYWPTHRLLKRLFPIGSGLRGSPE